MIDDIVARLRRDEAQLREYLHLARKFGGDECDIRVKSPDHLLLDLGEAISKLEAAEARVRELEAQLAETQEQRRQWQEASVRDRAALAETQQLLAAVRDDSMRLDNDYCSMEARAVAAESAVVKAGKVAAAEAIEQAAKCAEGCDLPERTWMPGSLYDTIRREVAAAIRSMRKEER